MIALAISVLWLLIGAFVTCSVVYLVLSGVTIPVRVERRAWVILMILILIAVIGTEFIKATIGD